MYLHILGETLLNSKRMEGKKYGNIGIFMKRDPIAWSNWVPSGDPYGIRTHVTAVKGRCLNRLTKGPNIW